MKGFDASGTIEVIKFANDAFTRVDFIDCFKWKNEFSQDIKMNIIFCINVFLLRSYRRESCLGDQIHWFGVYVFAVLSEKCLFVCEIDFRDIMNVFPNILAKN